ncbi:MAG: hypothetical protein ABR924_21470 [Terracidiphilus sp.]|jgi:hypothetical protein
MTTALHNDRIVNGLLKADIGMCSPEQVLSRLSQDVLIKVDPTRSGSDDLWPCIWALASILERQFYGNIYIDAGLSAPLASPVHLGPRCVFVGKGFAAPQLQVGIGISIDAVDEAWGDTRGNQILYRSLDDSGESANPIGAFALAGYLGFAVLAYAAGIPPFHTAWKQSTIQLPLLAPTPKLPKAIAIMGLGQIGQAFLSLHFFLSNQQAMTVHLVDQDSFEDVNYRSQILLTENSTSWLGQTKVGVMAQICEDWGWKVTKEQTHIDWQWKNRLGSKSVGFLGFDNMDARRAGVEGGFARLVECGVGSDFSKPRVSWHSLPPDRQIAKELFVDSKPAHFSIDPALLKSLVDTPGECGRVEFEGVSATAPCLGVLAVAFTWMELLNYSHGDNSIVSGGAYAWSPLQPLLRDVSVPSC